VADVLVCGDGEVDLGAAIAALRDRGLARILCEGGPRLFGELARTGLVDELCLTFSPMLAGPGAERITAGASWPDGPRRFALAGLLEEDGALFARYRADNAAGPDTGAAPDNAAAPEHRAAEDNGA
jgi:riboflavin biosynthesis pyrimidine reductase